MSPQPLLEKELSPGKKLLLARGALLNSAQPQLDGLISLAADPDAEVSRLAQETLARLSNDHCAKLLAEPTLPEPVARYFLDLAHVRPGLLPVLLAHPASPQDAITALAARAGLEALRVLLEHLDLLKAPALEALKENPAYLDWQKAPPAEGYVLDVDLLQMLIEEVKSESLQPASKQPESEAPIEEVKPENTLPALKRPEKEEPREAPKEVPEKREEGLVSKIAKMTVAKRVILALRGNKEERSILIRDGSRAVQRAVLSSPKLSESEVESFATQKNVSQDVLRVIAMKRKFIKDYIVLKNLVYNPRLPIDVGMTLVNHLMANDVRALAVNRDVSDTIRKLAHKLTATRGR